MKNIEFSNCMQVIEIIGILPNRVCGWARSNKLMDPQLTNYFPSETEGAESKDWGVDRTIHFWGTEIPKWFNYQSVEISIFSGLVANFQNWLFIFHIIFISLFTCPSMVVKKVKYLHMGIFFNWKKMIIFCAYFLQVNGVCNSNWMNQILLTRITFKSRYSIK